MLTILQFYFTISTLHYYIFCLDTKSIEVPEMLFIAVGILKLGIKEVFQHWLFAHFFAVFWGAFATYFGTFKIIWTTELKLSKSFLLGFLTSMKQIICVLTPVCLYTHAGLKPQGFEFYLPE